MKEKTVSNNISYILHEFCRCDPAILISSAEDTAAAVSVIIRYMQPDTMYRTVKRAESIRAWRDQTRFFITTPFDPLDHMSNILDHMIEISALVPGKDEKRVLVYSLYVDENQMRYITVREFGNISFPDNDKDCSRLLYKSRNKKNILIYEHPLADKGNIFIRDFEGSDTDPGANIILHEFDDLFKDVYKDDENKRAHLDYAKEVYTRLFDMLHERERHFQIIPH